MIICRKIYEPLCLVFFILCYFPFNQMIYIVPLFAVGILLFLSTIFCGSFKEYRRLYFLILAYLTMQLGTYFFEFNYLVYISIFVAILLIYYFATSLVQLRRIFTLNFKSGWISCFAVYTVISCLALVAWSYFYNDISPENIMANAGFMQIIALGMFFAVMNSVYEELYFRGALMHSLINLGNRYIAIVFQALAFAGTHYAVGFPSGYIGYAMTFLYGLMMAHLVLKAGSLIPAIILHFICDSVVFVLIYRASFGFA